MGPVQYDRKSRAIRRRCAALPETPPPFSTVTSDSAPDNLESKILRLVVEHVFMPPKLPRIYPDKWEEQQTNVSLCNNLIEAAQGFLQFLPPSESPLWTQMIKMMGLARRAAEAPLNEVDLQHVLSDMAIGGTYR